MLICCRELREFGYGGFVINSCRSRVLIWRYLIGIGERGFRWRFSGLMILGLGVGLEILVFISF